MKQSKKNCIENLYNFATGMKKKKLIQLMKQMLTIFILVVFVTFSTGVMVTIHECCKTHHHLCCDKHHENENAQSVSFYNSEEHSECDLSKVDDGLMTTLDDDQLEAEVDECSNHSHCFIITYLIKITDNFVVTEFNKDQVKSPAPLVLFENQLLTNIDLDVPFSELEILKVGPPLPIKSAKAFLNFTSQRIYYA